MKNIILQEGETIIAVVPEYASGPGWANQPLWIHIVGNQNKHRVECIQPEDQTLEIFTLFHLCHDAHRAMLKAISPLVLERKQELLKETDDGVVKTEHLVGPRGGKATIQTLRRGSQLVIYRSSHLPMWVHNFITAGKILQHISANTWLAHIDPAGDAL